VPGAGVIGGCALLPNSDGSHDMILLRTNRVNILANPLEIDGNILQDNLPRLDEIVLQVGIAQVEGVCFPRHALAIIVPVQENEHCRIAHFTEVEQGDEEVRRVCSFISLRCEKGFCLLDIVSAIEVAPLPYIK
jgi:hypothetical protein